MNEVAMRERDALLAAIRRATLAMKAATAEDHFKAAMDRFGLLLHERRLERRYNPNWSSQPRVPRGNRDGGRWTDGGASGGEEEMLTAAKISPGLDRECLQQYERDTFFCTMIKNRACHAQAAERYAACLAGRPIPPLNFSGRLKVRMATRTLDLTTPEGRVVLPIHIDVPEETDGSWGCRYEIGWPGEPRIRTAWGADSVQAIILALQMIGTDLYTSGHHKAGELSSAEGSGYGFPVPANLRDMLIGDDAKFF